MGGRSRVASQILAGKGFDQVINMAGGIKAWDSHVAYGSEETGLALFTGKETPEEALVVAYSLEAGLHEFYVSMTAKVDNPDAANLFRQLSEIEIKHQDRIFQEYTKITASDITREIFEKDIVVEAVEGGLTTEQYIDMFKPDWDSPSDIVSLAMSIEAQALDLYTRAAEKSNDDRGKDVLQRIAEEERTHLEQLGKLMDKL